jgi:hypothetical protein
VGVSGRSLLAVMLLISAGCGEWFDKKDFLPSSPSIVGALQLATDRSSMPADGIATALVTATISPDAALERRTVVFVTTTGTFVGSTAEDKRTLERTVDNTSATATVQLQSSRTVEVARVSASVKDVAGLAKEVLVQFTAPNPSDIIRLQPPPPALADGATITPITAEISGSLPAGRRQVTFSTTLGGFVGDAAVKDGAAESSITVDADSGNRPTVYLRSPTAMGVAFITAKVDDTPAVSAATTLQFTAAAPQQLLITLDKPSLPQDDTSTLTVTVTLIRDVGVPTEGVVVTFRAVDSLGDQRGIFTNVTRSNATGVATANFTAGSAAPAGTMKITASAGGLSDSAVLEITM